MARSTRLVKLIKNMGFFFYKPNGFMKKYFFLLFGLPATYILPAIEIRLSGIFHLDSFRTEKLVFV